MRLLDDIRDPGTMAGKVFFASFVLVILFALTVVGTAGYILYRVTHPDIRGAGLDPTTIISKPEVVKFRVPVARDREGWFFPGPTTAPVIILCHGYQAHRGDVLTLATALQKDRFNVLIFDFSGHGRAGGYTTLGYRETQELLAAIRSVLERPDVDQTRVGVWGYDLGAYAALSAAASEPRVRAIAVDSAYDTPVQQFNFRARQTGLDMVPFAATVARWGFLLLTWKDRAQPGLSSKVGQVKDIAKFFLQGSDNPEFSETTRQLFFRASEPRKQSILGRSNYAVMSEEERLNYETEIVHFFLESLPAVIIN
jgi:pimeloyl-ACP methyl ester carboxylesterase